MYKLGKRHPRRDVRTLYLPRYFTPDLSPAPLSYDAGTKITNWQMFLNDQLGDCGPAMAGHFLMATSSLTPKPITPADSDILKVYEDVGGYNLADPSTDGGIVNLDLLKYLRTTGLCGQTIDAFASADSVIFDTFKEHLKQCISLFKGAVTGIQLPQSAMDLANSGKVWSDITDTNILGGHDILPDCYDDDEVGIITWGYRQYVTWQWLFNYKDEIQACIWDIEQAIPGINFAQIETDLAEVTA